MYPDFEGDREDPTSRDGGTSLNSNLSGPGFGRSLLRALRNTHISVFYQDRDLRYVWAETIPLALWEPARLIGVTDSEAMPPGEAPKMTAAKQRVLETGEPERLELRMPQEEGARWFDIWIDADLNDHGDVQGVVTTAVDITEQKHREQTLRALLREVSHRSKNLLAIIQSVAMQTSRYSFSVDQFLTRFRGRIQSLASSQDLVTSSNWRGANLHELIAGQVALYCADPQRNIRVSGANPYLNPNAALHVGLALHELAVNSVSYGALCTPDGHVDVSVELVAEGAGATSMVLVWSERFALRETEQGEKRFGSVALERVVPASLNGTAQLKISADRMEYRLTVPQGNFEAE
jgi:two-component sensor histidine kinase